MISPFKNGDGVFSFYDNALAESGEDVSLLLNINEYIVDVSTFILAFIIQQVSIHQFTLHHPILLPINKSFLLLFIIYI